MSTGWRVWFFVLAGLAVVGGFLWVANAYSAFEANERLTSGAPQQMVVAQWLTNDLLTAVAGMVALTVLAFVSWVLMPRPVASGEVSKLREYETLESATQQKGDGAARRVGEARVEQEDAEAGGDNSPRV